MADKRIRLSETAHERLSGYKDEHEHTSFDSAIRELLAQANND